MIFATHFFASKMPLFHRNRSNTLLIDYVEFTFRFEYFCFGEKCSLSSRYFGREIRNTFESTETVPQLFAKALNFTKRFEIKKQINRYYWFIARYLQFHLLCKIEIFSIGKICWLYAFLRWKCMYFTKIKRIYMAIDYVEFTF